MIHHRHRSSRGSDRWMWFMIAYYAIAFGLLAYLYFHPNALRQKTEGAKMMTNGEVWLCFGLIFTFWVTNRHIENQFKRLRAELAASKDCKYGQIPTDPHTGGTK